MYLLTVEKLRRVLDRVQEKGKIDKEGNVKYSALERAIILEIGLDERTKKKTIQNLMKLGWIKRASRSRYVVKDYQEM